ncbi:MAG: ABC transporter permease [Cytophagales bacterium]|nr:ABC transporter permease [Armatimonadota bacterium]
MQQYLATLGRPAVALMVALLLGAVIIALAQKSVTAPAEAYSSLFRGAFGDPSAWSNTLARAMPLLLTGAAVFVALAAGLFNIGAEGQLSVGGLAAAVVGITFKSLPAPLLLGLSLLAAMAAGAAWGYLPAYLKVKRGAHEVITAILLNYVAQNTTRYLATGPLREPGGAAGQTAEVGATLSRLSPNYDLHWGLVIAAVAVALTAVALRRTVWGYETRAVGQGPGAAEAAGISVARVQINAMLISGALAGLAGAVVILGEVPFRRFPSDFYGSGYGFDGLAAALLAGGSAWALFPAALLFGGLASGAEQMTFDVGTPKQIVSVVQAILIIAVAARLVVRRPGNRPVSHTPGSEVIPPSVAAPEPGSL